MYFPENFVPFVRTELFDSNNSILIGNSLFFRLPVLEILFSMVVSLDNVGFSIPLFFNANNISSEPMYLTLFSEV